MADRNKNIDIKTIASTIGCMATVFSLVCATYRPAIADTNVEDKTSQFNEFLDDVNENIVDDGESELAEKIRKQRAALNAQSARENVKNTTKTNAKSNTNECDTKLRACMRGKCGDDFSKCAGDTDTSWGNKMDLCRMDTKCTGQEYKLFTTEIKADRDLNAKLSFYNATVKCGNDYNDCIITECGQTFTKCLGKSAGDAAVQKCSKVAKKCTEQDSGLSSRMMEVFGNLRGNAEQAIVRDEKRLYELRDAMRDTCGRLGAMFDERSLDCVYTVGFYAGEDNSLYASKKAYAGSTFNCTQDWFGVDITTFKENAFRLTRSQTSASSAALGAGVGMGIGAITSGAIDRAVDRAKAERALGEELCDQSGGKWQKAINKCNCPDGTKWDDEEGCLIKDDDDDNEKSKKDDDEDLTPSKRDARKALCEQGGKWVGGVCYCSDDTHSFDKEKGCIPDEKKTKKAISKDNKQQLQKLCETGGRGQWKNGKCKCKSEKDTYDPNSGLCTSLSTEESNKIADDVNKKITNCKAQGTWNVKTGTCDCGIGKEWDDKLYMCITKKYELKLDTNFSLK